MTFHKIQTKKPPEALKMKHCNKKRISYFVAEFK